MVRNLKKQSRSFEHRISFLWRGNEIQNQWQWYQVVFLLINREPGEITWSGTRLMKSCSSIRGSRDFKSIRRIVPRWEWTCFAIALSTSRHPTSSTLISFLGAFFSHLTSTFDESPPRWVSWPFDDACWYTERGTLADCWLDLSSVWSNLMASLLLTPFVGTWVNGFFRLMVLRGVPIAATNIANLLWELLYRNQGEARVPRRGNSKRQRSLVAARRSPKLWRCKYSPWVRKGPFGHVLFTNQRIMIMASTIV